MVLRFFARMMAVDGFFLSQQYAGIFTKYKLDGSNFTNLRIHKRRYIQLEIVFGRGSILSSTFGFGYCCERFSAPLIILEGFVVLKIRLENHGKASKDGRF